MLLVFLGILNIYNIIAMQVNMILFERIGSVVKVAKFHKISKNRFVEDWDMSSNADSVYGCIKLPNRTSVGSARYNFYTPVAFSLGVDESIRIPTGICVEMDAGWVLQIYPCSDICSVCRVQLDNTVGIIDGDYYGADNEGHIFIKITNCGFKDTVLFIERGDCFCSGHIRSFWYNCR